MSRGYKSHTICNTTIVTDYNVIWQIKKTSIVTKTIPAYFKFTFSHSQEALRKNNFSIAFKGSSIFRNNIGINKFTKDEKENLTKLAVLNRTARIICRKCFSRLPLNSKVCRRCKNPDIRFKKDNYSHGRDRQVFNFDKNTKQKMTNKLNNLTR